MVIDKSKRVNACSIDFYCSNKMGEDGCRYWKKREGRSEYNGCKYHGVLRRCDSKVAQVNSAVLFLKRELGLDNVEEILNSMIKEEKNDDE